MSEDSTGLLVKPDVAQRQLDAETPPPLTPPVLGHPPAGAGGGTVQQPPVTAAPTVRRFHGSVQLDPARVGRDAGRIAEEVIAHLAGLVGAEVTVTLEIEAVLRNGASDQVVRTVTENSRVLKFTTQGFETE